MQEFTASPHINDKEAKRKAKHSLSCRVTQPKSSGMSSQKSDGYVIMVLGDQLYENAHGFGMGTYGCDCQVSTYRLCMA